MEKLPLELMEIICKNLDITSIIFLSLTCKKFVKLTRNKNIIKNFDYIIGNKEIYIGFKDNNTLKYKKTSFYTCMDCASLSNNISDLITKCQKCKKNICKNKIYIGVEYSTIHLNKKKVSCYDCISNDKFIHKKEKKYIIEFYSPQFFNRNEWYKKTD